eukprot:354145-Chlamydomonas_euryale.AAC.5
MQACATPPPPHTHTPHEARAADSGLFQLDPHIHCTFHTTHPSTHATQLELLISGLPDVDIADMRANTEYTGYGAGSPVVRWFWEAVSELGGEDKALLLQFVTGTSKVPLDGFKALQ